MMIEQNPDILYDLHQLRSRDLQQRAAMFQLAKLSHPAPVFAIWRTVAQLGASVATSLRFVGIRPTTAPAPDCC